MIKLKELLKKEKLNEANIDKKVNTKEVVKRMLKNFKGQYVWVGKAWAKELIRKYPKGISQTDFIIDAENLKNNFGGQGIDKIFKGLNEGKLNEAKYGKLDFSVTDHNVVDRSFSKFNGVKLGAWEADVKGWNDEKNYKQFVGEFNANAFKLYDLYKNTVVKFEKEANKMLSKKHKLLKKWRRKDGQK